MFSVVHSLLAWTCVFLPICNLLIFPLKLRHKLFILSIITFIAYSQYTYIGNFTNIIILAVIFISISILCRNPMLNICFGIFGYLLSVCVNYIYILVVQIFGITVSMLETTYYVFSSIIYCLLVYIITFLLGKRLRPIIIHWQFEPTKPLFSRKVQLLCLCELFACLCIYQFNIIYGSIVGYPSHIVTYNALLFICSFIVTIVILCFLFLTLKKDAELTAKLQVFEVLQDYTAKVESLYLEIRTFKHDYLNILSTMELYMKEKRYTDLQHYFESKILPQGRSLVSNDAVLGKLTKLKIPELKSLLYPKLLVALNHHLDAVVDIKNDTTSIPVDYLDLTRILGIFMDNAIEAAVETQEKTLYIGFHTYDNTTIIRIRNSCNPVEHIDHIFDLDYSTKPGSRGIGLYNANLLIHKHPNIILKTTCGDNMFTQELKIIEGD